MRAQVERDVEPPPPGSTSDIFSRATSLAVDDALQAPMVLPQPKLLPPLRGYLPQHAAPTSSSKPRAKGSLSV